MKTKSAATGESPIDLIEEAVHLLREVPLTLHGLYAVGALPFVLGFLYFWADMSRGAFAQEHADRNALAMGLLFLWMKCWQSVYANSLRLHRIAEKGPPWTIRRSLGLALRQSAFQPSGLFILPLASVVMFPFPWIFSFYQNVTVQGAEEGGLRETWRRALRQTSVRAGQNYLVQGFLSLFILFVWLNVVTAMAALPYLLRTLFGIDTAFTQAGSSSVLNTTYLASSFALTYIFADPLVKAVYMLRCFYGQSLQSGDDLKSELAGIRTTVARAVPMGIALVFLWLAPGATAATNLPPVKISAADLDHSIEKVLQRPEFAWRMPREAAPETTSEHESWLARVAGAAVDMLRDIAKYCGHLIGKVFDGIGDLLKKLWPDANSSSSNPFAFGSGWTAVLQVCLLILIVVIAGLLGVLLFRLWQRRRVATVITATAVAARPDLNDENIVADQLPEDGWLQMAREMMAQGNLRLALRAFYLAGLSNLAARELIGIANFKSNREYEMELRRRARVLPAAQTAFSQNVAAFDRAWYGLHEVTQEALQQFQSNLDQIRA